MVRNSMTPHLPSVADRRLTCQNLYLHTPNCPEAGRCLPAPLSK